jgi:cyclopropane-fatty-acyl-phospholipid synthase
MNFQKKAVQDLLKIAGITVNGNNPWDIAVHNDLFYNAVMSRGILALGETYVANWWECASLDEFFNKVIRAQLHKKVRHNGHMILKLVYGKLTNLQSHTRAFINGQRHYDIGNELFEEMLDKRMVYTCGYWKGAKDLNEAQENKLDLVCRKIGLKPGMEVLDIGCGWGSFARFAAEKYGVRVTGITISAEQAKLGEKICEGQPAELKLLDYRDLNPQMKFDRIVSLGMFEHVGYRNYNVFMQKVNACLKDDGLFLLHTIGNNSTETKTDPWIDKYIFPNSILPSIKMIGEAIENIFVMEDWHNFSADYDRTLMAWYENFERNWDRIKSRYDEKFFRMWKYYLQMCAGSFRARKNQVWEIVLTKNGILGGYESVR